jgi:hypothetical protein
LFVHATKAFVAHHQVAACGGRRPLLEVCATNGVDDGGDERVRVRVDGLHSAAAHAHFAAAGAGLKRYQSGSGNDEACAGQLADKRSAASHVMLLCWPGPIVVESWR